MAITVREMRDQDARTFIGVHHAAVRGLATGDYPPVVIEAWAPLPVTEEAVAGFLENADCEIRLVAELGDEIVGIGALGVAGNELRACYVAPGVARRGVGSALVDEIERIARERGLLLLRLDSSISAEPFYQALGYSVFERGEHILGSGQAMACVKMEKRLAPPTLVTPA